MTCVRGRQHRVALSAVGVAAVLGAYSANAQTTRQGKTEAAQAGRVGERQTRDNTKGVAEPLARIENRVANRVQSRLRNRIDKDDDPAANTASPFEAASERVRRKPAR